LNNRLTYLARRLFKAVFVVLGIVAVSFFMLRLVPGDIADIIASDAGVADQRLVDDIRARYGLDQPLLNQFFAYMGGVLRGDLGYSWRQQERVTVLVFERLPATLTLAGLVLVFATVIGVFLGAMAAMRAGTFPDTLISTISLLFYATPNFWLGLMLVLLFAVQLRWLPPFGIGTVGSGATGLDALAELARHAVLPVLALGTHYVAIFARLTRAQMLEVAEMDYVRTARAKGLPRRQVIRRHILRNALLTVTSYAGLQAGNLVGGTVLVETVFAWPGIGRLAYDAILGRDYLLLLGIFIVISVMVILINLITDIVYTFIDPRIELK